MAGSNSQTISMFQKFPDHLQKKVWEGLSCEILFPFLDINKKSFRIIASILFNRKKKAYKDAKLYQIKLIKKLLKIKNTKARNDLLGMVLGASRLIDEIKVFVSQNEGKAVLYGWMLCAQYSGTVPKIDVDLREQLNVIGVLSFIDNGLSQKLIIYYNKYKYEFNLNELAIKNKNKLLDSGGIESIFKFISLCFGSFNKRLDQQIHVDSLWILKSLIKSGFSENKSENILNIIRKSLAAALSRSSSFFEVQKVQIAALYTLKALIKAGFATNKTGEILELVEESLNSDPGQVKIAVLQVLEALIKTGIDIRKVDDILKIIEQVLNSSSENVQIGALQALEGLIKTGVAFHRIDDIFKLITKSLHGSSDSIQNTARSLLETSVKSLINFNKIDELFKVIKKNLENNDFSHVQIFALQSLKIFIITSGPSNKSEEIFVFIMQGLDSSDIDVITVALEALEAFISAPLFLKVFIQADADLRRVDSIFHIIHKKLDFYSFNIQEAALQTLKALIKTGAAFHKAEKMLALIEQRLSSHSEDVQIAALQALKAFIKTGAAFHKPKDLLKWIQQSLNSHSNDVKIGALQVLKALIKTSIAFYKIDDLLKFTQECLNVHSQGAQITPLQTVKILIEAGADFCKPEDLLKRIQQGLNSHSSNVKIAALQALKVFIKKGLVFHESEDLLKYIEQGLNDNSDYVHEAALQAFAAYIKNKKRIPLKMWEKEMAYIWKRILRDADVDSVREQEINFEIFTVLIKCCPPDALKEKENTKEDVGSIKEAQKAICFFKSLPLVKPIEEKLKSESLFKPLKA